MALSFPMNMNNTPQLIVQTATEIRNFQLLDRSEWTIGREPSNLIQILDRFSSRFHAVIGVVEARHIYFRDLNSRNGSTLDGIKITEPVLLKHGDRIMIGSTGLVLKHNYVTTVQGLLPISQQQAQQQALMIHASAVQGKIWQELLLSQEISVLWDVPGANLQKIIGLQAAANLLPPLLIIDTQAIQEDLYGLSHWCRLQRLSVEILLVDSSRSQIPDSEQAYVKTLGFLDFLPALPVGTLCIQYQSILQNTIHILTAFQAQDLNPDTLLTALRGLDQLLSKTPEMVSSARQAEQDVLNSEDLTSLSIDPRKLRNRKPQ
jgi:pSer/pThr/pTyr-binding forkhead associated (FHA) protein